MSKKTFGIIDIGSNTIRAVIYKGKKADKDKALESNILRFTQNGILSEDGIRDLISSLNYLKEYFKAEKWYAFATSAMRDVKNFDEVREKVKKGAQTEIDLISGESEAEYCYMAIKTVCESPTGIAVDLGGGSAEIITFNENKVEETASFAIGAKRICNAFCKNIVPTAEEAKKIENHVKSELSAIKAKNNTVWFMGGTAKAAQKAAKKLFSSSELTPVVLEKIFFAISDNAELGKSLFGKRYPTMPSGLKIMESICESLGAEEIIVTEVGVRDGYAQNIAENLWER